MQNPPTIQDIAAILTALTGILTAGATVVVACLAYRGLNQWRETIRGQASFELPRKMILQAYDFRDNYHKARYPATYESELTGRQMSEDETTDQSTFLNSSHARFSRFELLRQAFLPLRVSMINAKYILDDKVPTLVSPLSLSLRELNIALSGYFEPSSYFYDVNPKLNPMAEEQQRSWWEQRERWKPLVFGVEADEHGQAVNKAVDELIAELEPFLKLATQRK